MDKMLIEEKSIEHLKLFADVSEEAKVEKLGNAKPPISKLLYWWTRKPLIVGRAVTLLATIPSTMSLENVKNLLYLNNDKRAFNYTPSLETYKKLSGNKANSYIIYDPFAGSGNLLFEASRLGLNCILMDYNPVAYLIMKASLEYPAIYGTKLAEDVEKYGIEVIKRAEKELGKFYERKGERALHYLWCWCIKCPYCGQRIPLTNQTWLSKKHKIGYRIKPTEDGDFIIEIKKLSGKEGSIYTQKGGEAVCIRCGNAIDYEHMTRDIAERRDKEMIVVVVKSQKGKDYKTASEEDKKFFKLAKRELDEKWEQLSKNNLLPYEELKESELFRVTNYGLRKWHEFFTERQLLLMTTLLKVIRETVREIRNKEYAKVIATYLGFLICKHVDYNCIGTAWHTGNEQIAHALSFRRPSIIYNFAETNPFEETSGSLYGMLEDIVGAIRFATTIKIPAKTLSGSAINMKNQTKFDFIITDPPYLEDVAYAELSEFFYVWLLRILKDFYPELPPFISSDDDLVLSKGRFGGDGKLAMSFYKKGMTLSFKNIHDSLKDNGLLIVFFAHSSTEAWNLILDVIRESKFRVISSYAVHTENIKNPLARGKTSFMSSIVLSCRKILDQREVYFESLMPQIEEEIGKLIAGLSEEDLLSIPITDLLIMAYGKVLEELTQYTTIKSYKANFEVKFENLIGEARDFILKEVVKKLTGRSPQVLGPDASFFLIAKIFYRSLMPGDEALKVVRAYGITVDALTRRGYIKRHKSGIRVKPFTEVALDIKPEEVDRNNIYQQFIYLLKTGYEKGVTAVKPFLGYGNFRLQELQYIVNLLIKHYRLLINKKEKLTDEEKTELQVLEALSDIMGQPLPRKGTIDNYI
jgi:adenine-specific DNA methylase